MNRALKIQYELLKVINSCPRDIPRDETLEWEAVHMASSARTAWLLAEERGFDPELAACAAAVHDYGRIITGIQKNHAEAGFAPVIEFLNSTGLFSEAETAEIALAVKNHSSKTVVGTALEEIVKDADVIDCYQLGLPFDRPEKEERYARWLKARRI